MLAKSVSAAGGGLDKIVVLMEGESLFNDATSIVLFEIFFEMVKKLGDGGPGTEGGLLQEGLNIVMQISWLAAGISCLLTGGICNFTMEFANLEPIPGA